jgi:murein DD-endopeptidase MepM/ murein hydrolase activator NlpD
MVARLLAACTVSLVLAAPASAVVIPPGVFDESSFVWPAQGTITTPFIQHGHAGIDIGVLRNLTVRAAASGVVERVGQPAGFEGYGNVVVIRDSTTLETLYAHLASWSVKLGDKVTAGQEIGTAGCTGMCTGTHLHFEVRESGEPVNPLRFLG